MLSRDDQISSLNIDFNLSKETQSWNNKTKTKRKKTIMIFPGIRAYYCDKDILEHNNYNFRSNALIIFGEPYTNRVILISTIVRSVYSWIPLMQLAIEKD